MQQDKLICANMEHVKTIAKNIHRTLPSYIEYDDVYSNGLVGLVNAAKGYKASEKVSFRHYASFRIRGAILDGLRGEGFAPRNKRGVGFCDGVSLDDVGKNHDAFNDLVDCASTNSINADYLARLTHNPLTEIEARSCYQYLLRWFETLPQKISQMLHAYYIEGKKYKEIGLAHGVTESRVCQITTEQISKLLKALDGQA